MFNINGPEVVILAILFMVLFGPERLPELAIQLGKLVHEFRQMTESATAEISRELQAAATDLREVESTARTIGEHTRRSLIEDALTGPKEALDEAMAAARGEPGKVKRAKGEVGAGEPGSGESGSGQVESGEAESGDEGIGSFRSDTSEISEASQPEVDVHYGTVGMPSTTGEDGAS